MKNMLFLCVANSARSQMAEGLARKLFGSDYRVQSAGSKPTFVHPMAQQVLSEIDIDTQEQRSKTVQDIDLTQVDLIITLCAEEICPAAPGKAQRLHWPLTDPAAPQDNKESQREQFRQIRDQIQGRLEFLKITLEFQPEMAIHPEEFHCSIRSKDLPASVRFYAQLLGAPPREWTDRYAIFYRPELQVNFVILVDDGIELHHDTLYHLGVGVKDKPARTTLRGTPLHELWLKDPDGNMIEIYAR